MQIQTIGAARTMSTREIADLVNSAHDSVLKTTRRLIAEGVVSGNETLYTHPQNGQRYPEILMDFRNSLVVASGYSSELRARVIDRWQELEASTPKPAELSRLDILRLAMESEEARLKAESALAIAAPKAAALDLISAGHDAVTITEAAKVLGIKRTALVARMHAEGWIYRQNQSWVAYDQHIKSGRLQYKEARYTDEKTGMECVKPYCHITPKGLAKLAVEVSA